MFRGDFWRTLPGMITAAAGLISALTALVAAVNNTGLTARVRGDVKVAVKTPATMAPAPSVDGAWRASVTYPWGATHAERFALQVDGSRLSGTATYLGAPRGIQDGVVTGTELQFTVRVQEISGSGTRDYTVRYRMTPVAGGLHVVLDDSRGTETVQFAATRELAAR